MKILMLIDALGVGGAESHVEILATELAKMGHEIIVASAGGVLCKRLRGANVRCVFLPKILKNGQKRGKISFVCSFFALQGIISRLLRSIKPDIVHAHTRRTAFLVNRICKAQKIPLIVTAHAVFSMKFPKNLLSKWGNQTIAVSEDIKKHLVANKIPQEQIFVVANGVKLPICDNVDNALPPSAEHPPVKHFDLPTIDMALPKNEGEVEE